MHTYVRRALQTALVTGGLVVAGASLAHAEEPAHDSGLVALRAGGSGGLLEPGPDQLGHAPLPLPVDVSGVALAVGGSSVVHQAPDSGAPAAPASGGAALVEA